MIVIGPRDGTPIRPDLLDRPIDRRGVHLPVRIWRPHSEVIHQCWTKVRTSTDQLPMRGSRFSLLEVSHALNLLSALLTHPHSHIYVSMSLHIGVESESLHELRFCRTQLDRHCWLSASVTGVIPSGREWDGKVGMLCSNLNLWILLNPRNCKRCWYQRWQISGRGPLLK